MSSGEARVGNGHRQAGLELGVAVVVSSAQSLGSPLQSLGKAGSGLSSSPWKRLGLGGGHCRHRPSRSWGCTIVDARDRYSCRHQRPAVIIVDTEGLRMLAGRCRGCWGCRDCWGAAGDNDAGAGGGRHCYVAEAGG